LLDEIRDELEAQTGNGNNLSLEKKEAGRVPKIESFGEEKISFCCPRIEPRFLGPSRPYPGYA
jgi:hypothetical protein